MTSFEPLCGWRLSPHISLIEVGEVALIGPELVYKAMEKVRRTREGLQTTQIQQKSYTEFQKRDLEYDVDD